MYFEGRTMVPLSDTRILIDKHGFAIADKVDLYLSNQKYSIEIRIKEF